MNPEMDEGVKKESSFICIITRKSDAGGFDLFEYHGKVLWT